MCLLERDLNEGAVLGEGLGVGYGTQPQRDKNGAVLVDRARVGMVGEA